ncbi:hypothetical protein [Rhizobium sp.]|uniref:hypothetical protein n=1 Tax=Rhizobium sp. TaxID=391 RepID=UPI0028A17EF5
MSEEEFSHRFVQAIVRTSFREKKLPFGRDPSGYAVKVVGSYWLEYVSRGGTPERYAREDAHICGNREYSLAGILSGTVSSGCCGVTSSRLDPDRKLDPCKNDEIWYCVPAKGARVGCSSRKNHCSFFTTVHQTAS